MMSNFENILLVLWLSSWEVQYKRKELQCVSQRRAAHRTLSPDCLLGRIGPAEVFSSPVAQKIEIWPFAQSFTRVTCILPHTNIYFYKNEFHWKPLSVHMPWTKVPVMILCLCQEMGCPLDSFVWYLLEVEQCTIWYVVWYIVASVGLVTSFITTPSRFCALFCTPTLCRTWCCTHTRHDTTA